jgi:DNA-binding CsgD family transcriptional regulator
MAELANRAPRYRNGTLRRLTAQELRVAAGVARGMTNDQIAGLLNITRRTVEFHLTNVYLKLRIKSRGQLAEIMWDRHLSR